MALCANIKHNHLIAETPECGKPYKHKPRKGYRPTTAELRARKKQK